MIGAYLRDDDEAIFKQKTLIIIDLLDDFFGQKNKYSNTIAATIYNRKGGLISGISYGDATEIIAICEAAKERFPIQEFVKSKNLFIDQLRIQKLIEISNKRFDLSKLIRLLEELNLNFINECYLSCAMISRAILDHIPPIFGYSTFIEVSNNYEGKSFKGNAQHLQNSLRNIADAYLHQPIRQKESLPTQTQINFSNDMDVILSEIIRILK